MHSRQCNQKLFEIVFREDGNRAIRGKPTIEQPLRDSADGIENLGISEAGPLSSGVSFGYADTVGKTRRPLMHAVGENTGIWAESFVGLDKDRAVSQVPHGGSRSAHADRAKRSGRSLSSRRPQWIGSATIAFTRSSLRRGRTVHSCMSKTSLSGTGSPITISLICSGASNPLYSE